MATQTAHRCREKGCPWTGDPDHCPWHSADATHDDDHAWDTPGGYARYRGARDDRRT